jgi:hypothetical protein
MNAKRKIEIYSAGCPVCQETIKMVQNMACTDCEVSILDMNDPAVANRAKGLGVRSVPSVAIDGKLADCCAGRGPDEATLKARVICGHWRYFTGRSVLFYTDTGDRPGSFWPEYGHTLPGLCPAAGFACNDYGGYYFISKMEKSQYQNLKLFY